MRENYETAFNGKSCKIHKVDRFPAYYLKEMRKEYELDLVVAQSNLKILEELEKQ